MNISMYRNSTDVTGKEVDYKKVLEAIADGKYRDVIQDLRSLLKDSRVDDYTAAKRLLPSVTFAGTFSERKASALKVYSGMIIIDIDSLTPEQIIQYKNALREDGFVHACFISPSGSGLKILFKNNNRPENHLHTFLFLEKYFKEIYAVPIDKSGKDVSRLCYISYDPDIYINEDSTPILIDEGIIPKEDKKGFDDRPEKFKGHVLAKDASYAFKLCIKWTERHHQYVAGNRNNFLHILASNLNRAGVDHSDASLMIFNEYSDLPTKEVEQLIRSAYSRKNEHNSVDIYNIEAKDLPEHTEGPSFTMEEETIYNDTMHLLKTGVKKNLVFKLIKSYGKNQFDFEEKEILDLMKQANDKLHESSSETEVLDISKALELYSLLGQEQGGISTCISDFDEAIGGRIPKASFVGLIADGGCYKSIYAQCIASKAVEEDKVVLYLSGEMALYQIMIRVIEKELGIRDVKIVTPEMAQQLKEKLKNNFFLTTTTDWTKEGILTIVSKIKLETGKDVELIVIDGLTQMSNTQNNEILSAISNAEVCKKISKEANNDKGTVVLALVHISGTGGKHFRNTFENVRGGKKMLNNMDSYICNSLLVSEEDSDIENGDIFYKHAIFYSRLIDKRNTGAIVSKIIQVHRPTRLEAMEIDPHILEVKTS